MAEEKVDYDKDPQVVDAVAFGYKEFLSKGRDAAEKALESKIAKYDVNRQMHIRTKFNAKTTLGATMSRRAIDEGNPNRDKSKEPNEVFRRVDEVVKSKQSAPPPPQPPKKAATPVKVETKTTSKAEVKAQPKPQIKTNAIKEAVGVGFDGAIRKGRSAGIDAMHGSIEYKRLNDRQKELADGEYNAKIATDQNIKAKEGIGEDKVGLYRKAGQQNVKIKYDDTFNQDGSYKNQALVSKLMGVKNNKAGK
jgi:hypothetical protein